jgi:PAS domain S-box-containing protein
MSEKSPQLSKETKAGFLDVANQLIAGIAQTDLAGRFVLVNDFYCEIVGYAREELLGKNMLDITHPNDVERNAELFRKCVNEGESFTIEKRYVRKDGAQKWVRNNISVLRDATGKPQFVIAVSADISSEKNALESLEESDERYRDFITRSAEAIWRFELDKPIPTNLAPDEQIELAYRRAYLAECNDRLAQMYGYETGGEMIGMRLADFMPRSDEANVEYLRTFITSNYRLENAESHEFDRHGNPKFFVNNLVGVVADGELLRAWGTQRDITAQKSAEQKIGESEKRYRTLAETASDAIIQIDETNTIIFINPAAERIFGYATAEMLGKSLTMLMPENLRERHQKGLKQYLETGEKHIRWDSMEVSARHKSGRIFPLEISFGEFSENGKRFFIGIGRDVSARKEAEKSNAHLAAIVESSDDAIISKNLDGFITSWNRGAERMFGYRAEEIVGKSILTLVPEHLADDEKRILENIRQGVPIHHYETVRRRKDGSPIIVSLSVSPLRDKAGNVIGASKIARDITHSKETEDELLESQAMLALTMRSARMGAWSREIASEHTWWSDELEEIFGLPRGGFSRTSNGFYDLVHEADRERVRLEVERAIAEKRDYAVEFRFHHADGSVRWMEGRGQAVYSDKGEAVRIYGIGIDITERKRAEEKLLEVQNRLESSLTGANLGVWTYNAVTGEFWADERAKKMHGLPPDARMTFEIAGENLHPEDRAKSLEALERAIKKRSKLQIENRVLINGDTYRWIASYAEFVETDGAGIFYGVVQDITERKQAEARLALLAEISELARKLEDSDEFLFAVAEAVGEHLQARRCLFNEIDLENDREIVYRDYCRGVESVAGVHKISDYSPVTSGEMQAGKTVVNFDSKTDPRTAADYEKTYKITGERAYIAVPLMREGRWTASLWVSDDAPRRWNEQEIALAETIAERAWSVVEKLRIDAVLRESEESLRLALEAGKLGTWATNPHTKEIFWDARTREIFGVAPDEPLSYDGVVWKIIPAEDHAAIRKAVRDALDPRGRGAYDIHHRVRLKDGSIRWLHNVGQVVFEGEGDARRALLMRGTVADITERKRQELNAAFLAEVSQSLSEVNRADEIIRTVGEKISAYLNVSNCVFGEIDEARDAVTIEIAWSDERIQDLTGIYKLSDYITGDFLRAVRAGETVVIRDTQNDPRTDAAAYAAYNIHSFVTVPFKRDERWKYLFSVHDTAARDWRADEIELIREVSNRFFVRFERAVAEDALRESEERLRMTTEAALIYSWDFNLTSGESTFSENVEQVLGFRPPAEMKHLNAFIHPDDAEKVNAEFDAGLRGERPLFSEFRFVNPATRDEVWVASQGVLLRDAQNQPTRAIGITQNITERKLAEENLRESEERFRTLFDSIDEGFVIVEMIFDENRKPVDYRFIEANPAFERLTGLRDALGRTARELVPDLEEFWFETYGRVALTGEAVRFENKSEPMERWFDVYASRVGGEDSRRVAIVFSNVTERKLSEERLRKSESDFRQLANAMPQIVWVAGADGKIEYVNEKWLEFSGLTLTETRDSAALERIYHPEDIEQIIGEWEKSFAAGTPFELEGRIRNHKTGKYHWFLMRSVPIKDADGTVQKWFGTSTDISFNKEAELRLRESEDNLRMLADSIPQLAWMAEPDGFIFWYNRRWYEYTGTTPAEMEGWGWQSVHDPAILPRVVERWKDSIATGEPFEMEFPLRGADGVFRWFLTRVNPLRDSKGEIVRWFGTNTDIDELRRMRETLVESEKRFRNMADHAPVMIWVTDAEGSCNYLSQSWYEFTGQTPETGLGFGWLEVTHPDDKKSAAEIFLAANEKREPFRLEYRLRNRNGEYRWAIDSAQPRFGDGGEFLGYIGSVIDIHERRAAEEKIRENESTLRAYYNSSPLMMGIVELDEANENILHVYDNPATCEFFGVAPDATASHYATELGASPEVVARWIKSYRKSRKTNRPVSFEYEQPRGDDTRWLSATVSFIGETTGGRARFAYVAEDTTERKRSEQQIRYQLDLTETITNNTQMCLLMMDAEGRGTFANHATERVTGFKPEELIGEILHYKIHHTHPDGTPFPKEECPLDRALPIQQPVVGYEDTFVHKDGHFYPVRCNGRPIYKDGKPVGTVIEVQDITEEKRLEREREEAQKAMLAAERRAAEEYVELLSRIVPLGETLGTARELISIYRAVGDFVRRSMPCSAFFVSFFDAEHSLRLAAYAWGEGEEIETDALPPMPISAGGGPNSRAILNKETILTNKGYMDVMRDRPHVVLQDNGIEPASSLVVPMIVMNRVVGTLEVQAHDADAFNNEHIVALEMVANLAAVAIENVRLLKVEETARREAESANRAKDEFLSVLSHELRTPLNSMFGWVRMLKSGILDETKTKQAIEVIERNVRLQNSLIEDLLDVSRIISGKMGIEKEETDFAAIVATAVEAARPSAEQRKVSLVFDTEHASYPLLGDEVRLQQVVNNLINNAVKFTPEDGLVSLKLTRAGASVVLTVTDTGIGIEPQILPRIFDRFLQADSTTKRTHSGLGLGLTIVRHLTELHGGQVTATSEGLGKGATFTVELPLARTAAAENEISGRAASNGENSSLKDARILLVDDDTDAMMPLQIILENQQARVACASSALEALEKLAADEFDLIVSDVGMPQMDGYDFIQTLRNSEKSPNRAIPAIALTAYASAQDKERALKTGFQQHFAKPIDFDNFLAAVKNFIQAAKRK